MDKRKDAIGVCSALELRNSKYDLLSTLHIKRVCTAVINRYDQKTESAELTSTACEILEQVSRKNC